MICALIWMIKGGRAANPPIESPFIAEIPSLMTAMVHLFQLLLIMVPIPSVVSSSSRMA